MRYGIKKDLRLSTSLIDKRTVWSLIQYVEKGEFTPELFQLSTIDEIIAETGVPTPDLVIITVNGVEVEALQGMKRTLEKGTNLVVAAKYVIDGLPTYQPVTAILRENRYEVILDHYGFTKNEDPENHAVVYAHKPESQ